MATTGGGWRFFPGQVVATPGAIEALQAAGQSGELDAEDQASNEQALQDGSRLLSAYVTRVGVKLWIITEAADDSGCRPATTLLLPDEY
jgi:hypothetical protein